MKGPKMTAMKGFLQLKASYVPESGDQHDQHRLAERVRLRVMTWRLKAVMAASDGGFELHSLLQLRLNLDPLDQGLASAENDYGQ